MALFIPASRFFLWFKLLKCSTKVLVTHSVEKIKNALNQNADVNVQY